MLMLCWHNGAMGHVTMALLECCTNEGNREFPSFVPGQNLHHFRSSCGWYRTRHPNCDIPAERKLGNRTLACTSRSDFGRFLILLMGLEKSIGSTPKFNSPITYKQEGQTYGDQLESLSLTLRDKVYSERDWLMDADMCLDVLDYWQSPASICQLLSDCGLTPVINRVHEYCHLVSASNQRFFDKIATCRNVVDHVFNKADLQIELDFWQVAVCHAMLLHRSRMSHEDVLIFDRHPMHTRNFMEIFNV